MMNFVETTSAYESWLGGQLELIPADVKAKHNAMRAGLFPFFRATFYRWAQIWPDLCKDLCSAPAALSVGDLHVENFGTWRDFEGRLVWGVNDFDEAWRLPCTFDLVRLAASALVAARESGLNIRYADATGAILEGYRDSLGKQGEPIVLAERHLGLRRMAVARLHDPSEFWRKMDILPTCRDRVPESAAEALARLMPERDLACRIVHRVAGLGSLGRQRFTAIADWHGGRIAREVKALAPSACLWAAKGKGSAPILYQRLLDAVVRCPDPFFTQRGPWILRRLAPDCSRIELSDLPKERDETRLLHAMGWETANIHLGSLEAKAALKDLESRTGRWLDDAAGRMADALIADWKEWGRRS
jgi:uncharacterized protein (DUF2252 family)